ncbi:MAG: pentapeptide repeat-containing protein [Cellvibrionales bacterium]|nr:pentapeptide repeat-containing protein [Cellvibrionales bacterium]
MRNIIVCMRDKAASWWRPGWLVVCYVAVLLVGIAIVSYWWDEISSDIRVLTQIGLGFFISLLGLFGLINSTMQRINTEAQLQNARYDSKKRDILSAWETLRVPTTADGGKIAALEMLNDTQIGKEGVCVPGENQKSLAGIDLSAQTMGAQDEQQRTYLVGVRLPGANLQFANLSRVNFTGADFSGVNLSGADLSNADLSNANLSKTCFCVYDTQNIQVKQSDDKGYHSIARPLDIENQIANLSHVNLSDANVSDACFLLAASVLLENIDSVKFSGS